MSMFFKLFFNWISATDEPESYTNAQQTQPDTYAL